MVLTRNIITMGVALKPNTVYNTVWTVDGAVVHQALATTPADGDPKQFFDRWAETAQLLFDVPHVDITIFEVSNDTRDKKML